ncbi:MAG: M23 family metallopeptidase [Lachnospiraceae bacterium]|nr:M23 family metallopeptidase [Lachnospiraceae bacterium]
MKRRRRRNQKRERAIMLMSSLLVLTALTMTGVYVKERNKVNQDYVVDLSQLQDEEAEELAEGTEADVPGSQLVTSNRVENPASGTEESLYSWLTSEEEQLVEAEDGAETLETDQTEEEQTTEAAPEEELTFPEGETLTWPVVGNVLIGYSMDKPVYFASLEQYKVNPGIVIQATEGQQINAAAKGRVTEIVKEEETGNTIYMDIGSGYQAVYGQLTNIQVKEGDLVEKGAYMADVAAPTKYYSVEGCNVYFALLKDGVPQDPMGKLN